MPQTPRPDVEAAPGPGRAYSRGALLAAGGTMVAWAIGLVLIRTTTSPVLVVSFWRLALAVPLLLLAFALSGERRLPWGPATVGGLIFAVHQVFHFGSLRYASVAVASIIFSLQPLVVGLAGRRVTGELASRRFFAWAAVAVLGAATMIVASAQDTSTTPLGIVLAVGNLLAFSAYYLATKRARAGVGTTGWLLVMTSVAGVVIGALALTTGASVFAPSGTEWATLAAIAIVPATLGHLLITWAHPRIHAAASSTVILGVPVLASLGAWGFLGEPFGLLQGAGGLLALTAAAIAMRQLPPPATDG